MVSLRLQPEAMLSAASPLAQHFFHENSQIQISNTESPSGFLDATRGFAARLGALLGRGAALSGAAGLVLGGAAACSTASLLTFLVSSAAAWLAARLGGSSHSLSLTASFLFATAVHFVNYIPLLGMASFITCQKS